ncbi:MAG: DMT family transporter, partial [Alphaproteobacteria bacterium]
MGAMPAYGQRNDAPLGIAWMIAASFFFAVQTTIVKYVAADGYSALQILWVRYLVQMSLVVPLLWQARSFALLRSRRPALQMVRSGAAVLAAGFGFAAFAVLPLTLVTSVHFAAPFIVAALSVWFLHERINAARWIAIAVGFAGVLVIVRPGTAGWQPELLLPVAGATFYAIFQMLTRAVAAHDPVSTSVFYAPLVGTGVLGSVMPFVWFTPDSFALALMLAIGLLGAAGQASLTKATQSAAASVVSPFQYSQLLWVTGSGFILFGTLPDGWTLV